MVRDPARVDVSLRRHGVRHGRGDFAFPVENRGDDGGGGADADSDGVRGRAEVCPRADERSAGEVVAHGADQQWGLDTGRGDAEYSLGDVAADAAGGLDDPTGGG